MAASRGARTEDRLVVSQAAPRRQVVCFADASEEGILVRLEGCLTCKKVAVAPSHNHNLAAWLRDSQQLRYKLLLVWHVLA